MPVAFNPGQITVLPDQFSPFDTNQFDWIVGDEAPDEDTMSQESGVAFMAGYLLDHDALYHALAYFVGYSKTITGVQTYVNRWNPAVHPRWPFMRCDSVSVKGIDFNGREVNMGGIGRSQLPLPVYERYRFDISFRQFEYDHKEDNDIASEWERSLTVDPSDEGETILVDGGQYVYKSPTYTTLDGKPVTINGAYLKTFAQRSGLTVRSYGLPHNFLMNEYNIATKFLQARGHVNSTTFLGQPAGTMLLQRWGVSKKAQPIATKAVNALTFGCVAEMHFGFTDPDRAEASETLRGWQLVPGIGTKNWYGVQGHPDTPIAGDSLYPEFDMNQLLQLHSS